MNDIKFPFGEASEKTLTATGAQALAIDNNVTIIDGVTTEATGNRTLNLTIDESLKAGALIFVKNKTNGTETLAFGDNMQGKTITGVAGKTKCTTLVYDGSNFVEMATPVQID